MAKITFPTDLAVQLEEFVPASTRGPRKIGQRVEFVCRDWMNAKRILRERPQKGDEPVPPGTP